MLSTSTLSMLQHLITWRPTGSHAAAILKLRYVFALAVAIALSSVTGWAQISVPNASFTYAQDFNTLPASGTGHTAVPAGWAFFETLVGYSGANTYRAGDASGDWWQQTYDTYSLGAAGNSDRAFGSITSVSQDSSNSTIGVCFTNNTGAPITSLTVTYTGETWRVASPNRQDGLVFQYNQNTTAINGAGTWTALTALNYFNPGDPTLGGGSLRHSAVVSATISGLDIAPGNTFCFRWLNFNATPVTNTSQEDALGIDDFVLSDIVACVPPTITAPTVTQPTCASPTGTIVVNATGSGALEYSINNGSTWQSSNTYGGQASGNYIIKVRLQANPICEATYGSNPEVLNSPFAASTTTDTWTGCVSTDWATSGNWADGSVPTAADDVIIPNVADDPVINGSTAALAKSVLVQAGAVLTLNAMGSLTINNSAVHGLDNYGTVDNSGSIIVGNTTAITVVGIVHRNGGAFSNKPGGVIQIDQTLGAQAFYSAGLVNNEGTIEIGSNAAVSGEGIRLEGNTFNNTPEGNIQIDSTGSHAIRLLNTGTILNNEALIEIGGQSEVRGNGVRNGSGCNFNNRTGGDIRINRIGIYDTNGIPCLINFGTFTNDANITVGNGVLLYGQDGIYNAGSFSNSATAIIAIEKPWGNGIWNVSGTFQNAGQITISNIFYFEDGEFSTGILSTAPFSNHAGAEIHIDRVRSGIVSTNVFTNAGLIRMGENAHLVGSGIANIQGANAVFNNNAGGDISIKQTAVDGVMNDANSTFNNNACATLSIFDNLNNAGTFTNAGLMTVNTTEAHTNSALTNNGIIAYPLGNPIPNVTNNEIIIAPTTANACDVISPAFDLGSPVDFTIEGIFTDEAATMSAGTYETATNTFTPTAILAEGVRTFYVEITDGGCTRILPWQLTTEDCCDAPQAICKTASLTLLGNSASLAVADVNNGSTADCGLQSIGVSPNVFNCSHVGTPQTVTLTITDVNGIAASCLTTVTVRDQTAPTISCPTTQTVAANAMGNYTLADFTGLATVLDNCTASPTVTQLPTAGSTLGVSQHTIALTATDGLANTAGCNFTLVVQALDCAGTPGGTAFLDNCNTCVGGSTGLTACVQDCNGDYGGTAFFDNCNTCVGGNTGKVACVQDCNGDYGGTAFLDNCNTCVGGNTGEVACVQDCNGEYGGTASIDQCNVCSGGNTGLVPDASCLDCEGVPNGPAQPGTPCDDGDPTTINDTWTNDCQCTGTQTYVLSGNIVWEHDLNTPVAAATVALSGDDAGSDNTNGSGDYELETTGGNLTLTPTKNDNPRQGVDVADAARIRQHALGTNRFNDGYKVIAADVNESNSVTSVDAVIIQQALLGNAGAGNLLDNPAWRFVDATHTFVNENAPWGFPMNVGLTGVTESVPNIDFVGVKMGDVNGSGLGNLALTSQPATWLLPDAALEAGSTHRVAFTLGEDLNDVAAWQFALRLDPAYATVSRITPKAALPLTREDFGTTNLLDGELRSVFAQAQGQPLKAGEVVFELELTVRRSVLLSEILTLDNDILDGRVYNTDLKGGAVKLAFAPVRDKPGLPTVPTYAEAAFELYQNVPNPFVDATMVAFSLPNDAAATITVHDASGRVVTQLSGDYAAGYNTVRLTRDALKGASGILTYTVTAGTYTATRRMLVVE